MRPRVKFKKWQDPVAPLLSQRSEADADDPPPWDGEAYRPRGHLGPCIIGPMGIIPVHESNLPSKLFQLYMGHTNFVVTPSHVDTIKNVVGVEALDPFTPYRFRVAVGQLFRPKAVLGRIREALCGSRDAVPVKDRPSGLEALKRLMGERHEAWAIFVLPDGRTIPVGGENREAVLQKGEAYASDAQKVITSW
jgi:hypothetical protein